VIDPDDAPCAWCGLDPRVVDLIDPSGDCWEWTGSLNKGYGQWSARMAHRLVWEVLVGPIPDGLTLDHLCRNSRCVNPDHLEPVTQAENNRRGYGWPAANARKTHCPEGHPYSGRNLILFRGSRYCRECKGEWGRTHKTKRVCPECGEPRQYLARHLRLVHGYD
jgi:hypothetical protein